MSKREMDIKEIRDGPLSVGDFHCSLEDWRLSRATILSNTTRNQMKKKGKSVYTEPFTGSPWRAPLPIKL